MIQLLVVLSSVVISEPFFAKSVEQTISGRCGSITLEVRRRDDLINVVNNGKVVGSGYSKRTNERIFGVIYGLSTIVVDCIPSSTKVRFSGYDKDGKLSRYFVDAKNGSITESFE